MVVYDNNWNCNRLSSLPCRMNSHEVIFEYLTSDLSNAIEYDIVQISIFYKIYAITILGILKNQDKIKHKKAVYPSCRAIGD